MESAAGVAEALPQGDASRPREAAIPQNSSPTISATTAERSASAPQKSPEIDLLRQYKRSLEHIDKKKRFVQRELERRSQQEKIDAPHKPSVSPYVRDAAHAPRDVVAVAHSNDEWKKRRDMVVSKKRDAAAREELADVAPKPHIDPNSAALCQRKGHRPIYVSWKEVQQKLAESLARACVKYEPTFIPETFGYLAHRRRSHSADAREHYGRLSERSRSATVERLYVNSSQRRQRRERVSVTSEELRVEPVPEIKQVRRSREEIERHLAQLQEWHRQREALREHRRRIAEDDIELTFHPYVSRYSKQLAVAARYHCVSTPPPPPQLRDLRKPRNRRTENAAASNVARCAPLPQSFLARNERLLQSKRMSVEALQRQQSVDHDAQCTFSPAINPVSAAIVRLAECSKSPSQNPDTAPRFMRPTETLLHRSTSVEHAEPTSQSVECDAPATGPGHQRSPAPLKPSADSHRPVSTVQHPPPGTKDIVSQRFEEMQATLDMWKKLVPS